jgi:zinc protease
MRQQTLSALDVIHNDPQYLADSMFDRVLFAGTPYSRPAEGTEKSIHRLTAQDLKRFHALHYVPGNALLAVVGDISAGDAFDKSAKYFGSWPAALHPDQQQSPAGATSADQVRIVVINKPDAVQTEIRVGNLAIRRDSSEFYALNIANQILGGPASNHLFNALRSQHGLVYGASSDLELRRTVGSWVAKTSTRTDETLRTVDMVLEQMKRLRDHPLSREEVQGAQNYLVGHEALDFETAKDIASEFVQLLDYGLPLDYWATFPEHTRALAPDDVWQTARRYLDPDHAVMVLVGNAATFEKGLNKLGPVEVLTLDQVDEAQFAPSSNVRSEPGASGPERVR